MSRNVKGSVGFFLLSLLFGYIVEVAMVVREVYQWKHFHLPKFEWDDIVRYSMVIAVGGTLNLILIKLIIG